MTKLLKKILVIDDDEDILVVAKYSLQRIEGVTIKSLSSGEHIIQEALEFRPDLILLDVMMPVMDGLSTLKVLRSNSETVLIPVIFFTAKAMQNELDKYRLAGAIDVIIKPFDPLALPDYVQEVWKKL